MDITVFDVKHPFVKDLLECVGKRLMNRDAVTYDCTFSDESDKYECIISVAGKLILRSHSGIGDQILNHIYEAMNELVYINPEIICNEKHIVLAKGHHKKFLYYSEIMAISHYNKSIYIVLKDGEKFQIDIWAPGIRDMYITKLFEYYSASRST